MNDAYHQIILELQNPRFLPPLTAKKGDTGRILQFILTDRGEPYVISSECCAMFTAKKPDGKIIYNECAISGNTITYAFTPQTCAVAGALPCELKLYGANNKLITSSRFTLNVEDTVYEPGDTVESASEVSALTALVSQTAELLEDLEQKLAQNAFADAHSAVCFTPQSLTDSQTAQARTNIGAAPGFRRVLTAEDDMDRITEDGIYVYSTSSVPANAPFANAAVVMVFGNDSSSTQKIQIGIRYGVGGQGKFRALYSGSWFAWAEFAGWIEPAGHPGCYYRYTDGVQEWISPPMVPGVEYRTMKRRNGKAVYVKYVDLGNLPASGSKSYSYCSAGSTWISYDAFLVTNSGNTAPFPYVNSSGVIGATITATKYNLLVQAQYDVSAHMGYAVVRYTKD